MKNYFTEDDEKLKWITGDTKTLLKTIVCDVTSQHNTAQNGIEGDYIIMDAPDWVIVIPEKNEKPEIAAIRELQEETGFIAEKLTKLGMANPNPALFSNHVHVYLAENLKSTGIQHLDQDEFINYIEIPKEEVLKGMGTNEFPHALMSTALCFYLKYKIKIGI